MNHQDPSSPAPVNLLVYAIRNILEPTPEYAQLDDLIHLFSMLEFWRIRAVSVASAALVWQTYHKQAQSQSIILLNDEEEQFLNEHDSSNDTWRQIFIGILSTCISTHLLRLWESDSHSLFYAYWNEYFKPLENPDVLPVQPFHHRLSINDIDQLLDTLHRFTNLLPHSKYRNEDNHNDPSPIFDQRVIELIDNYLQYVPQLVTDVLDLFPDSLPLPQ